MKNISYSFLKYRSNKKTMPKLVSGFTLIELLVTISIFVIVTGVVLVNSNKFDSTVLLHNFAYDVALTIKQAQSYGVNVKESSAGTFGSNYGVYFNIGSNGGSRTNFVLFDANPLPTDLATPINCETTPGIECLQKYSITKGTTIQSICASADVLNNEKACDDSRLNTSQLVILFTRPNLNAKIYKYTGITSVEQAYAKIVLASADGSTSTVVVTSVGQIYVKKN